MSAIELDISNSIADIFLYSFSSSSTVTMT